MWAIIPIFLYFSSGYSRAILKNYLYNYKLLNTIMGESAVRLGHLVSFVTLADRGACLVESINQFASKLLRERFPGAIASRRQNPAERQCGAAIRRNFHRYLIGCATDTAGANFHDRCNILESAIEHVQRILLGALLDQIHGFINETNSHALLAAFEHMLDHGLNMHTVITDVGKDLP